jgi:hypothetical protein
MEKIYKLIEEFFQNKFGTVIDVSTLSRPNHQRESPPGDGFLTCFTVQVIIDNISIFGVGSSFLADVYPRYRTLYAMLNEFLAERGYKVNSSDSTISVSIVPYPNPHGKQGIPLAKLERPNRGKYILSVNELAQKSAYYKKLTEKYDIEYGVLTTNGTVVGPDGGIIAASCMIAETFGDKIKVIELGTGAGTTATALLANNKISHYYGNDFSPEITNVFNSTIRPKLEKAGVMVSFKSCSCFDIELKIRADLFVVGVYYQAQPDLFEKLGKLISECVGNSGVLLVQSGKPENPFITQLLYDTRSNHQFWPWYSQNFSLKKYFKYISEQILEDETMLIASNNFEKFYHILKVLAENSQLKRVDMA